MAKKAGWNWLVNSRKWHFFALDGRSLCGKFMILGSNEDSSQEDKPSSPDNCKACLKKRQNIAR
jgi:hypothetical protein